MFEKGSVLRDGKLTAVRNVCGQRYLYTPLGKDGVRDWSTDDYLNRLEDDAGTLWPSLVTEIISLKEPAVRSLLSRFIAVMHLRNVEIFNLIDRTVLLRDQLFGPLTPEQLADRGPDLPDPTDATSIFTHTLISGIDRIFESFAAKQWYVLCASSDFFVTSDRPVMFFPNSAGKAGVGVAGSTAIFPLSPQRMLIMVDQANPLPNEYVTIESFADRAGKFGTFNREFLNRSIRFALGPTPIRFADF